MSNHLSALKRALQKGDSRTLERLAAELVSKLIDVRLTVAKSGFQHGADAGTVGRAGRRLRLECKRYADGSPFADRDLQGGIDDALKQDGALEAWILCSTRDVPEQTEASLNSKTVTTGVPVIIIDWRSEFAELPTLAALCAWAPEIVDKHYGAVASAAALALSVQAQPVVQRLVRELSPWSIGYRSLLGAANTRFNQLWSDAAESKSVFGQCVAGGTVPVVSRQSVTNGLEAWWQSDTNSAAVVHGSEGMGKTWAVVLWAHSRLESFPIFLMLPSSAFKEMRGATHSSLIELIGNSLHDLNPGTDRLYWRARVERLLQRPISEGPALLLLVDGANQEPSVAWERIFQLLEGSAFRRRIRLVVTAQTHFLQERLLDLRRLSFAPIKLEVGRYDLSKGGEFDSLLKQHGLKREDLPPAVIELARVPRMFELTIRQKADAALQGEPTVPRLLWAHARDELGLRARGAMSAVAWEEWLQDLANRYKQDILAGNQTMTAAPGYSTKELGEMVRDPAGSADETARRLDEIVSEAWLEPIPGYSGRLRPTEAAIHLALGLAVLGALDAAEATSAEAAAQVLDEYLDAVRSTSAAADILASALSVLVDRNWSETSSVPRLVLSALLRSQNASDQQRQQAVQLAPALVGPLLCVVEDSSSRAFASARQWALVALRGIAPSNRQAWGVIVDRLVDWVARVDCPESAQVAANDEAATHQAKRLIEQVGTASPGVHRVLGVPLRLQERGHDDLSQFVPQLLLGKPLLQARAVLVAAAVVAAVTYPGRAWAGLKWLLTLNPNDREAVQAELERLSMAAQQVAREPSVHADMGRWVSDLLLWLTGDESLELKASRRRVMQQDTSRYSKHYLSNPARSLFPLEHRHLDLVWVDTQTPTFGKLQRAKPFLADPALTFPPDLVGSVVELGRTITLQTHASARNYSAEDHNLDSFLPAAARVAPQAVDEVIARWFATFGGRQDERRHWAAMQVPRYALLIGPNQINAIRDLRSRRPANPGKDERFVLLNLLEGELLHAPVDAQLDILVTERDCFISTTLVEILHAPETDTVREFVHRWGLEDARAIEVLCSYLTAHPSELDDELFERLVHYALGPGAAHQTIAFMALAACQPERFGHSLLAAKWRPQPSDNDYLQDAGSKAILEACKSEALADCAELIAPWCLLAEAVGRGARPDDVEVAVAAVDRALLWNGSLNFPAVARISVETVGTHQFVSYEPSAQTDDEESERPFQAFDPDARWARHQAARDSAETYLSDTKSAGAVMATRIVSLEAARALIAHCPVAVARWLEGLSDPTQDLVTRVNLAGGLFLALCEALLESDPVRGAQLWHVLRRDLRIEFVGLADLNVLQLLPFRSPDSAAVIELRQHLLSLSQNPSDDAYRDLALAALSQGQRRWLETVIEADGHAQEPFRRRRAIVLRGCLPTDPGFQPQWRVGEIPGSWEALRVRAQEMRNRSSQARYWWRAFLSAPDQLSAFCAWQVFLACADKLAWTWMEADVASLGDNSELWRAQDAAPQMQCLGSRGRS